MNARNDVTAGVSSQGHNYGAFSKLHQHLQTRIIGQQQLVDSSLMDLLADGHLMVEGAPGLAKTTAIKELAVVLQSDFRRIQFTTDLLPDDLTGTDVYRPTTGELQFQQGPLFHNLILADEISRAPAKVQSALLEAIGEQEIPVGRQTCALPRQFMVLATQNLIEHEGSYPLPEAQLDRFLLYVRIGPPDLRAERAILKLARQQASGGVDPAFGVMPTISQQQIFAARSEVQNMHMAEPVEETIVQLVMASRNASHYDQKLATMIQFGASPRATIALDHCARAVA